MANITVPLVGMVDMAIAGHLDSSAAVLIGGVTIGSMLFDLLYWNFEFLRSGTGGFTAQAWGRKDIRECGRILCRGVGLSFIIAFILLAIQVPFTKAAFLMVQSSDAVKDLALKYFLLRIWAAPATLSLFAFKGWFIGMQDSMSSMLTDLLVNCVNIAASIFFSRKIGFLGIPLGTVVAQYSGLILAMFLVAFKYRTNAFAGFGMKDLRESFNLREMISFMKVNGDLFVRSICLVIIYIGFTVISARFGDELLAASSILMKILMIFSYFTDGFAYAGQALCGRFVGSRELDNLRLSVRLTFIWSMSIGLIFVLVYGLGGVPIYRLMTSDVSVIDAARPYIPWLVVMPLLGCPAFTWDGVYTGATASSAMRNSALWATAGFFAVWFGGITVSSAMGLSGQRYDEVAIHILMASYFMHLLVRTVYQSIMYRRSVLSLVM